MQIPASLIVNGSGLTANNSTKQTLVKDFDASMNQLLGSTTGFKEIRETRVNASLSFRREMPSDSRIGFNFVIFMEGGSNLSLVNESLPMSGNLTLLNQTLYLTDLSSLQNAVTYAESKLEADVCSVYPTVEKCKIDSYTCKLSDAEITCTHKCRNYTSWCNGECYFDDLQKKTMCRCTGDGGRYYAGEDCSVKTYKLAISPEAVIGISAGLGGALLLVILIIVLRMTRNSKKANGNKERSFKVAGFDREGESQLELRHYGDFWQNRHYGTDVNSFSERPYTATQDNLGNPIYLYRPNDRDEQPYTDLKPGSSLSSLNLPESKFEISRPKIILGR
ncbi:hypothetical protein DPMN_189220 [Dreissena polymorpha]|uniref:Uncharacterized protein n=2 Tax=Dreissena polymorpha TaxID=45954 RepID=A0A9D4DS61_DREPO|nr:hypothetical protein DPMN_189220 [Dreissena polymorpha]